MSRLKSGNCCHVTKPVRIDINCVVSELWYIKLDYGSVGDVTAIPRLVLVFLLFIYFALKQNSWLDQLLVLLNGVIHAAIIQRKPVFSANNCCDSPKS